jgi:hypothetical protein
MASYNLPRRPRKRKVYKSIVNPLLTDDDDALYRKYRFTGEGISYLEDILWEDLEHPTNKSRAIPTEVQICAALRFYATGGNNEIMDFFLISRRSRNHFLFHFVSG